MRRRAHGTKGGGGVTGGGSDEGYGGRRRGQERLREGGAEGRKRNNYVYMWCERASERERPRAREQEPVRMNGEQTIGGIGQSDGKMK